MNEIWKPIPKFRNLYEVSNYGKVRRLKSYNRHDVIKSMYISNSGYFRLTIYKNGRGYKISVGRLVAQVFIGKCPRSFVLNHKDGIKTNNFAWNLEYVTQSDNQKHAYSLGLQKPQRGEDRPMHKLTENQVREIRKRYVRRKVLQKDLACEYGVCSGLIGAIVNFKKWRHII